MAGMAQEIPSLGYPVVSPLLTASAPLVDFTVGPWYEGGTVSSSDWSLAPAAKEALLKTAQAMAKCWPCFWPAVSQVIMTHSAPRQDA